MSRVQALAEASPQVARIAKEIGEALGECPSDCARSNWVDVDDLGDAVLDGHFDLIALAERVLKAITSGAAR